MGFTVSPLHIAWSQRAVVVVIGRIGFEVFGEIAV